MLLKLNLGISFLFQLSSFFFFDLLKWLQKELFDIRPLIQNHLTKSFQVCTFSNLKLVRFWQTFQFFILFFDNLFILELNQLSFLFKIRNDLNQVCFKQIDFSFQHLNLFILLKLLNSNNFVPSEFTFEISLVLTVIFVVHFSF